MNSSQVPCLVFDIGNVVGLGDEKICRSLLYGCGASFVNTAQLYSSFEYYEFLRGRITSREFYTAIIVKYLRCPLTYEEVHNAFKMTMYATDQGVVDILSRLNRQNLAFLTDTNVWQEERLLELVDLRLFSNKIFKSHEIGMVKTDEQCFPYVLSQLDASPEEVLLVDDSSEKVEMAHRHGWQTFQFIGAEHLSNFLISEGWLR